MTTSLGALSTDVDEQRLRWDSISTFKSKQLISLEIVHMPLTFLSKFSWSKQCKLLLEVDTSTGCSVDESGLDQD